MVAFLSQVTSNFPGEASQVDYVYDGLQNRRLKLVDSTDYTWTRYDANGAALADYDYGASYWEIGGRERSFHGGAEIAGSNPLTGTPSYYLRNHLGSIAATTNATKNIVASYQYTPYGEFLSESTTGDHATFGYTGHRLDRELNHYYAKYRYYNPTTMRWLKRDPLRMVDGPNVYAYVRGNVVNAVDPDGLRFECWELPSSGFWAWWGWLQYVNCCRKLSTHCSTRSDGTRECCKRVCPDECDQCGIKYSRDVTKCATKNANEIGICLHKAQHQYKLCYTENCI